MSSVEESKDNDLFLDICDGLKDQNFRTDLEYEVMNSSLEESMHMPHYHQSSENIYETFDFLKGGDNSFDNKETAKQNDTEHTPIDDTFSSCQQNVCDVDKDSSNPTKQPSDQDVKGDFQFTVSDVLFLTKVVHTQVVGYISDLVVNEESKKALTEIDKPIIILLQSSEAPEGLLDFVKHELRQKTTLMDLEPSLVIKVIDAVHYRSVLQELLQSMLLNVISSLCEIKNHQVLSIAVSCIASIYTQENLQILVMDESHLGTVRSHLDSCSSTLENIPEFSTLMKRIYKDDFISESLVKLSM